VLRAADIDCAQASDEELLRRAGDMERILVTRDRDFGALVFLKRIGSGVVYLRIPVANLAAGHDQLTSVLSTCSEDELRSAFVVVEPTKYRFRKLRR